LELYPGLLEAAGEVERVSAAPIENEPVGDEKNSHMPT
jgi:hypothetical protein